MIKGHEGVINSTANLARGSMNLTGNKAVEDASPFLHIKNMNIGRLGTDLLMPYLASINNLESVVEKTADKTMKITYTLTEEA